MERGVQDPVVQTYGLGVLRNLSYLPVNRLQVAHCGSVAAALRAMRTHLTRVDVQSGAYSYLFNTVIDHDENVRLLLSYPDLLPTLFATRELHADEAKLMDKMRTVLYQLARCVHCVCVCVVVYL